MLDAFSPPESDADPRAPRPEGVPAYVLYTPGHISGATFLGSPLAGGVLVVLNAQRLGRPVFGPALQSLGVFAALFALAMILPEWVPGFATTLAGMLGMRALAEHLFGSDLAAHAADGGATAPWWHAALIGLAAMVVLLVGIVAVVLLVGGF